MSHATSPEPAQPKQGSTSSAGAQGASSPTSSLDAEAGSEKSHESTECDSATQKTPPGAPTASELPPLTPRDFRAYNRLAEKMDYFHNHFRQSWFLLYNACTSGRRPSNMSLKQFIDEGLSLVQYLEAHHSIEETYFFPLLARKMPEFRSGAGGRAGELVLQHRQIHAGMEAFEDYLRRCRNRETELELPVLKEKMDSWGDVLLRHLDQEVLTLGAENMRKYWTLQELRSIPI
ncbi:hypothetical protein VTK73DRAFT_5174 [Phialemonium thermophilum]|uniref:Hemerythrin-like domain-containing protein n=1 Tax=Phialemonium thermophilum TaxID=223376 RepID=A0ABR3XZ47_9PEZI